MLCHQLFSTVPVVSRTIQERIAGTATPCLRGVYANYRTCLGEKYTGQ